MKLTTDKKALSAAMKNAAKIANPKASIPILSHVAIDFDGEICTVTANDSIRTYSERFAATGDPGQCTIEAAKLAKAVAGMKSGDVVLTDAQISQGRSKIKLESRNYGDFPQPDYEDATDCGITASELKGAIASVGHALPTKDVRPMLNGVHLCEGYAVATDGLKLAHCALDYKGGPIIIPAETVRQLPDIAGRVMVSDRQIMIDGETARYTSNLVEQKYPEWTRFIPKDFRWECTLSADDLADAIRTAQLGGDSVRVSAANGEIVVYNDKAEAAVSAEFEGELKAAFYAQYLIDAIGAANSDEITVQIGAGRGEAFINGRYLVMPVKL